MPWVVRAPGGGEGRLSSSVLSGDSARAAWRRSPSFNGRVTRLLPPLGVELGDDPSETECENAIIEHGAFVLINDFSARDVQADELASVGFGFVKCKNFCTAMGSTVVTADESRIRATRGCFDVSSTRVCSDAM